MSVRDTDSPTFDPEIVWDDMLLAITEHRLSDAADDARKLLRLWTDTTAVIPRSVRTDPRNGRIRTPGEVLDFLAAYEGL